MLALSKPSPTSSVFFAALVPSTVLSQPRWPASVPQMLQACSLLSSESAPPPGGLWLPFIWVSAHLIPVTFPTVPFAVASVFPLDIFNLLAFFFFITVITTWKLHLLPYSLPLDSTRHEQLNLDLFITLSPEATWHIVGVQMCVSLSKMSGNNFLGLYRETYSLLSHTFSCFIKTMIEIVLAVLCR